MFIYVIGVDGGLQKIGITGDVPQRFRTLQRDNSQMLHFRKSWEIDDSLNHVEKYAHYLLKNKRIKGEWFDVTPDEAIAAVERSILDLRAGMEPPKTSTVNLKISVFRYLVSSPTGVRGGFDDLAPAVELALSISQLTGEHTFIRDRPPGEGPSAASNIIHFLHGKLLT